MHPACGAQVSAIVAGQDPAGIHMIHKAHVVQAAVAPYIGDVGLPHLIRGVDT